MENNKTPLTARDCPAYDSSGAATVLRHTETAPECPPVPLRVETR